MKDILSAQIAVLQSDARFLDRCQSLYAEGLKDWHIIAAVMNLMLNRRANELKLNLYTRENEARFKQLPNELKGVAYPAEHFLTEEFARALTMHAMSCLQGYGFEERGMWVTGEAIEKFLRTRMRHFDLDIPHKAMFGTPPGEWPV